ncbi:hypothetical protein E1193_30750 [Micromonospora sp. KC606]|uniref:hypothetical protein n=1 Tax=Micromonospora sp. KC606 TaxID=2530379 RepID=UPI0010524E59|nr:hypothetical protein [Micromonospora sp. KC606]TDC69126.1 hypothetical protein E1193_30750 [Micromonospora sp. KC606]
MLDEPIQLSLDGAIPARRKAVAKLADESMAPKTPTNHDIAMGIARSWIKYRESQNVPVVANNALHALKSLILPFLDHDYAEAEVKRALNGLEEGLPSKAQMERALVRVRGRGTRPAHRSNQAPGTLNVNDAWADNVTTRPAMAGAAQGGDQW